ncbi:MAG TPA: hypothetical protein VHZ78_07280 [Rhizomicrobium sp.]|jgi:hypothetical protein|nr:hypothetical protein [Rhizomicrobium sp.]
MPSVRGLGWPLIASIVAAILLAIPLWCVATPAMPDYPAHLASFALIGGAASHYYTIAWQALPNLASEALVPLLAHLMPLELATRLFLTTTVVLWVLGPAAIQRALFGRVTATAVVAAIFAYNANFIWGFFNYSFATGLCFVLCAAWIATDRRRNLLQQAGFALAFTLIYFSHLFAFAVLLLTIGCFELSGWLAETPRTVRKLITRALPIILMCLPAAFAFLVLKPAGADSGHLAFDLLETLSDRFEAAIQLGFDTPALVLTGALILLFAAGVATGRLIVHPRLRLALVVLALCTLFAPEWALGGWGVHMRLPAVLGAIAFAACDMNISVRAQTGIMAAMLFVLAASAIAVALSWQRYDAQYTEFRAHAADIRQGARILTVLDGDSLGWSADQPYWHMAEFAVIDRAAFTPLMFTTAGQHIVHIRPAFAAIAAHSAQQGSPPDIDELEDLAAGRTEADEDLHDALPYLVFFQCHYDQALVIHGKGPLSRAPPMLRPRASGSFYTLYDIVPDARCAGR